MTCSNNIQLNDIGTSFEIDITDTDKFCAVEPVDLISAATMTVRFLKPDGTSIDRVGSVYTGGTNGDATDGIVQYETIAGDMDQVGSYQGQVIITFTTGAVFNSSIFKFNVKDNLL